MSSPAKTILILIFLIALGFGLSQLVRARASNNTQASEWKTYSYDKYGFQFAYPGNFIIEVDDQTNQAENFDLGPYLKVKLTNQADHSNNFGIWVNEHSGIGGFPKESISTENIKLGNVIATKYTYWDKNQTEDKTEWTKGVEYNFNDASGNTYRIMGDATSEFERLVESVIATFKFTK